MDFPTRGPNILDIFITNRSCLVEERNAIGGISDHEAVLVMSAVIAQLLHPPKEVCFRARNWQLRASLKIANYGNFWTQKHSIFGNFKVFPVLANSITRCLTNAQHSISDSLVMLPKMVASVIHSQHIQIWQFAQCFCSTSYYINCGFWLPFLEI